MTSLLSITTTTACSVNGATGVRDLYIVFKGSGCLANVNWFQFL